MQYRIDLSNFDDIPTYDASQSVSIVEPARFMCYCQPAKPGPPGPPGKTGKRGRSGRPGTKGDRGVQGEQGIPGEIGYDGEQGIQGPKGDPGRDVKGEPGERGFPGEKGETGPPPTQEQIMEALIQVIGDRQIISVAGRDGVDGVAGRDGADGMPGQDGRDGQDGRTPSSAELLELIRLTLGQMEFPKAEPMIMLPVSDVSTAPPAADWAQYLIKITNVRNIMADAYVVLSPSSLNIAGYVALHEHKSTLTSLAICSTNNGKTFCVKVAASTSPFKLTLVSPGFEPGVMPRQVTVENTDTVTLDFGDTATYEQHIDTGAQLFVTIIF